MVGFGGTGWGMVWKGLRFLEEVDGFRRCFLGF